jgi:hypothetical protein
LLLSLAGAVASIGFLAASGIINYSFGFQAGRTLTEQYTLGAVAVLAVIFNGLAPFFMQWAPNLAGKLASVLIWLLCLIYTCTSAIGFAADNRNTTTGTRIAQYQNLGTVQDMLKDELAKKKKDDKRIADLRRELIGYRNKGAIIEPDGQAELIGRIFTIESGQVRTGLVILFALLIEICGALGLYTSLSHLTGERRG